MKKLIHKDTAYCSRCHNETNHQIHHELEKGGEDEVFRDEDEVWTASWSNTYQIIECKGCGAVSYRTVMFNDHWSDEESYVELYPPRAARREPAWLDQLKDDEMEALFKEIYQALQGSSNRLALMGTRCILDLVLTKAVGDSGNFGEKLQRAEQQRFLSANEQAILQAALDAGHAASHRNFNPKDKDLEIVVSIAEHLVQRLLIFPDAVTALRGATPQRNRPGVTAP